MFVEVKSILSDDVRSKEIDVNLEQVRTPCLTYRQKIEISSRASFGTNFNGVSFVWCNCRFNPCASLCIRMDVLGFV